MNYIPDFFPEIASSLVDALNRDAISQFRENLENDSSDHFVALSANDVFLPTLLRRIVFLNRMPFLEEILQRGPPLPPLAKNAKGETPLLLAAKASSGMPMLRVLITSYGADESANDNGDNFLHCVFHSTSLTEIDLQELLQDIMSRSNAFSFLNEPNHYGQIPFDFVLVLHSADSFIVRCLVHCGAMIGSALLETKRRSLSAEEESKRFSKQKSESSRWTKFRCAEEKERHYLLKRERAFERFFKKEHYFRTAMENEVHTDRTLLRRVALEQHEIALRKSLENKEMEEFTEEETCLKEDIIYLQNRLNREMMGVLIAERVGREHLCRKNLFERVITFRCKKKEETKEKYAEIIYGFVLAKKDVGDLRRLRNALQIIEVFWCAVQTKEFRAMEGLQRRYAKRIQHITRFITKLLLRENVCAVMVHAMLEAKKKCLTSKRCPTNVKKIRKIRKKLEKPLMILQFLISFAEIVYMGVISHTSISTVHNSIDLALTSCELLIIMFLPFSFLSFVNLVVALAALIFCACKRSEGSILITLNILKIPFVLRAFNKEHSGTNTFCRAIETYVKYLFLCSPFFFAFCGGILRYSMRERFVPSKGGVFGSAFYLL